MILPIFQKETNKQMEEMTLKSSVECHVVPIAQITSSGEQRGQCYIRRML